MVLFIEPEKKLNKELFLLNRDTTAYAARKLMVGHAPNMILFGPLFDWKQLIKNSFFYFDGNHKE
jgi:hypothetical protein